MKKIFQIWHAILVILPSLGGIQQMQAQNTATCNMLINGVNYPVNASVLASCESGKDFNLSITLPGLSGCGGNYSGTITTSSNLLLGSNFTLPIGSGGPNIYTFGSIPTDANGENVLIAFKFKPGETCDGEKGDFTINVTTTCAGGQPVTCQLKVSLTAIAQNYWRVEKTHLWGDLKGGNMIWKVRLFQLPHPLGIGDYNIANGKITDVINCDYVTSVTNVTSGSVTGLFTNTAQWQTGAISSYQPQVEYIVTTVCCSPAVTTAQNCANISLDLGKYSPTGIKQPCNTWVEQSCASKPVVTAVGCTVPFSKSLVNAANTNYAQGCEGEYLITIQNAGNIPISNLVLNDILPTGIGSFKAQIYSSPALNMNFTSSCGPGNLNTGLPWTSFTSPFTFSTTSGSFTYGTIYIRIRFTITATAGTVINNCATLNYSGIATPATANLCGIVYIPCPPQTLNACVPFTVQPPKSIPGLAKCIPSGQQSYLVGDKISFCLVVTNHGQSPMTGFTLSDLLGPTPQNLELAGNITYSVGTGYYNGSNPYCCGVSGMSTPSASPPSWLTPNVTNLQSPSWAINGMPGECRFDQASYLVIRFDALIKPQNYGNYTNSATLSNGTTPLNSTAVYNILRIAKIQTTKMANNAQGQPFASTGYVNPGGNFQYLLRITNNGTVGLNNINIKDAFPACVTFVCPSSLSTNFYNANGTLAGTVNNITCSGTSPVLFTLPTATALAPGQYIDIITNVTRTANSPDPCCNPDATANGSAADLGGQTIQDSDGPVCVKKTLCCDMEEVNVSPRPALPIYTGPFFNFGLNITAGNLPIQEVEVSLVDYHITYSNTLCKPASIGNPTGHLTTSSSLIPSVGPGLSLTPSIPPVANNALLWQAGTPVLFTGLGQNIKLRLWRPSILGLPCCKGKIYFCVKVRIKDVKCRVCEKIICFEADLGQQFPTIEKPEQLFLIDQDFQLPNGN